MVSDGECVAGGEGAEHGGVENDRPVRVYSHDNHVLTIHYPLRNVIVTT